VYVELFKKMGWKKVSMLTDGSSGEFPYYHKIIVDKFQNNSIELASRDLIPRISKDMNYGQVIIVLMVLHPMLSLGTSGNEKEEPVFYLFVVSTGHHVV